MEIIAVEGTLWYTGTSWLQALQPFLRS